MLKDEFRVASAEQLPRALCECQLCQGLKATYVRLKAAAELGPLLANLLVREDFAEPDETPLLTGLIRSDAKQNFQPHQTTCCECENWAFFQPIGAFKAPNKATVRAAPASASTVRSNRSRSST